LKIVYPLVLLLSITGLSAKELVVKAIRQLSTAIVEPVFFPSYSADGARIYYTGNANQGLYELNRSTLEAHQLTAAPGAGYRPLALKDGSVIFRQDSYQQGRKYTALVRIQAGHTARILEPTRFLSPAEQVNDLIVALAGNTPLYLTMSGTRAQLPARAPTILIPDNLALRTLADGSLQNLEPLGPGNYIWGQLSSASQRVVFTLVGQGTYICDLKGQDLVKIGPAHAAQWSPDGQLLVYMQDLDDGERYTSSEIWVTTARGKQSWMITDTPEQIEMYPCWSPDGEYISYHTLDGELFEAALQIVD